MQVLLCITALIYQLGKVFRIMFRIMLNQVLQLLEPHLMEILQDSLTTEINIMHLSRRINM